MTDTQALYSELKPDLEKLASLLFDLGEFSLRKRGAFLPYGGVLKKDNEPKVIMAAPDGFEERDVSPVEVLPLVHKALRQAAQTEGAKAVAVAEDVRITPEGEKETRAIKVLVEHNRGLSVAFYLPYSKRFLRGYQFGEMIVRPAEAEVRAWHK